MLTRHDGLNRYEFTLNRQLYELRIRADVQFLQDVAPMGIDRAGADVEELADLPVRHAVSEVAHNLDLPFRQHTQGIHVRIFDVPVVLNERIGDRRTEVGLAIDDR